MHEVHAVYSDAEAAAASIARRRAFCECKLFYITFPKCCCHVETAQCRAIVTLLVLQGNAATKLRCGGKFFIFVISYFIMHTVKEFLKSANILQSYSKNKSCAVSQFSATAQVLVTDAGRQYSHLIV